MKSTKLTCGQGSPIKQHLVGKVHRVGRPNKKENNNSNALLRSRLQSLKTEQDEIVHTTEPEWVSKEEASSLCSSQIEFLIRKRRAAAGLGPLLPPRSNCSCCGGEGMVDCRSCQGTGLNPEGLADTMFDGEHDVLVHNGLVDPRWLFMDQGPCWLCKGTLRIACRECAGVGIPDILDKFSAD